MADLSEDDKVATLASVTGVEDLAYCRRLLEAHEFDLEAAVNTAIGVAPPPDALGPEVGGAGGGAGLGVGGMGVGNDAFNASQGIRAAMPSHQAGAGAPRGARGPSGARRAPQGQGQGAAGGAPMNPLLAFPVTIVKNSLGIVFTVVGFGFKVRNKRWIGEGGGDFDTPSSPLLPVSCVCGWQY